MADDAITVCGTGIVGLATALGLAKSGKSATLVGPRQLVGRAAADVYHPRVYAISPASREFLQELGVWSQLDPGRLTPVESMEIYGDADGKVTLHAWQAAQPVLAWIVESGEIERVLQQAVQVYGIKWLPENFTELTTSSRPDSGRLGVVLESGTRLACDLVIGADGARSPLRAAAGLKVDASSYHEIGLVAHLTAECAHQQTALQWFRDDGVLALLPLPDTVDGHQVSMVWSMQETLARDLQALPRDECVAMLERKLQYASQARLGRLRVRSPLFGFPLTLEQTPMVAPGIALVGDAAHRVHPLAGQGLNLGLGDARALIRVLNEKESYRSVGDLRVLRRYKRARAEPVMAMRLATDGLHRLFAARSTPLAWARNQGMLAVEHLPFIKQRLIAGASGE